MNAQEEIVRSLLRSWSDGLEETKRTWKEHCTDDIVWWNSARGALTGIDACLQAIDAIGTFTNFSHIEVPIKNLIARDGLVVVERSDDLYATDGSLIVAVPVVGCLSFRDDKIAEWRDYCDDWMRAFRPAEDA